MPDLPRKVEVSHRTIIFTVIFLLSLWILYQIRGAILILFIGLIMMAALNRAVTWLENTKIPRPLAIFLFYLLVVGSVVGILVFIIPPLVSQTGVFLSNFTENIDALKPLGINTALVQQQAR